MKTKLIILTLAIVSCILTTTTVFAQTIYTWTGAGDETNIANAANWSPAGGPPNGNTQDTGQSDGVAPGEFNHNLYRRRRTARYRVWHARSKLESHIESSRFGDYSCSG